MMTFLTVFLSIVLVLDCLVLLLLVLIQLPKKEAGAGLAFGGGASDALFGAGAGNVLTRITKWSAGIFFGLSLLLSLMNSHARQGGALELQKRLAQPVNTTLSPAPEPKPKAEAAAPAVTTTNTVVPPVLNLPLPGLSNAVATNKPAK